MRHLSWATLLAALGATSCAAVWDFQDGALGTSADATAPDASRDAGRDSAKARDTGAADARAVDARRSSDARDAAPTGDAAAASDGGTSDSGGTMSKDSGGTPPDAAIECVKGDDCDAGLSCDKATHKCTTTCGDGGFDCNGCCASGTCAPGSSASACGLSGDECIDCSSMSTAQLCSNGACVDCTGSGESSVGCPSHEYCENNTCHSSGGGCGGCH